MYHTDSDVIAETAITVAYTHPEAEAWLTDVLAVIRENYEYLCRELCTALPQIRISPMDGTYLAWIDFGAYVKAEDMHAYSKINAASHQALANGLEAKTTSPLYA